MPKPTEENKPQRESCPCCSGLRFLEGWAGPVWPGPELCGRLTVTVRADGLENVARVGRWSERTAFGRSPLLCLRCPTGQEGFGAPPPWLPGQVFAWERPAGELMHVDTRTASVCVPFVVSGQTFLSPQREPWPRTFVTCRSDPPQTLCGSLLTTPRGTVGASQAYRVQPQPPPGCVTLAKPLSLSGPVSSLYLRVHSRPWRLSCCREHRWVSRRRAHIVPGARHVLP